MEKEGEAAFAKFKGKGSDFIFCGTYIWIHDMTGVMRMHPIKWKMEGRALLNLKDRKGKMFFVEMNKKAGESGSGWVEYVWPKPGEKAVSQKISYIKLAKHGDQEYVIGCGVYDLTEADVQKALGK
ncbi:MAG: cache domain-containing protein [Planctomycetota bacterium]